MFGSKGQRMVKIEDSDNDVKNKLNASEEGAIINNFYFFFFQAEDGIRDGTVTGVQTCALPILPWSQDDVGIGQNFEVIAAHVDYICPDIYPSNFGDGFLFPKPAEHPGEMVAARSEERRVGKECRCRWSRWQ